MATFIHQVLYNYGKENQNHCSRISNICIILLAVLFRISGIEVVAQGELERLQILPYLITNHLTSSGVCMGL